MLGFQGGELLKLQSRTNPRNPQTILTPTTPRREGRLSRSFFARKDLLTFCKFLSQIGSHSQILSHRVSETAGAEKRLGPE